MLDKSVLYLLRKLNKKQIETFFIGIVGCTIWLLLTTVALKRNMITQKQSLLETQQQINSINRDLMRITIGLKNGYYLTKMTELHIAQNLLKYNSYCGPATRISILECRGNEHFECRFWYHIRYEQNTYRDFIRSNPVIEERLLEWQSADTVLSHLMKHDYIIMPQTEMKVFFSELDHKSYSEQVRYITNTVISRHKEKPYLILVRSEFSDNAKCTESTDKHRAEEILSLIHEQK